MKMFGNNDDGPAISGILDRPIVAQRRRKVPAIAGYILVGLVGVGVLAGMSSRRMSSAQAEMATGAPNVHTAFAAPQALPQQQAVLAAADPAAGFPAALNGETAAAAPAILSQDGPPVSGPPAVSGPPDDASNHFKTPEAMASMPAASDLAGAGHMGPAGVTTRLSSPAVVVDLDDQRAAATGAAGGDAAQAKGADSSGFLHAVSGGNSAALATKLDRPDAVITEGTVIGATLETAINSDLPGLARAVIARNVMSFDGTRVLIPRGSRVIGEYKSGATAGASRVFVIWTRLIRPDGVSIQLSSPGGDDLGRGGLSGKIDRHFLQRFGGSLLMSVVNGGINAGIAAMGNGIPVYINSVAEAGNAAMSAVKTTDIPPTIKAPQGSSVKIFVARDLDFSGIEAAR